MDIGRILNQSRQYCEYYVKKALDPEFHPGPVGGHKGKAILKTDEEIQLCQFFVIELFKSNVDMRCVGSFLIVNYNGHE